MEEIYIEETNKKIIFKYILVILFVFGLIIGGYIYFHSNNILRLKRVTVELGDKLPEDLEVYVKNKIQNINDYKLSLLKVPVNNEGNTDEVGEFKYSVKYGSQKKNGKIIVKDTKAPVVEVKELTIGVNEKFMLDDFVTSCEDLSLPCKVTLKTNSDEKLFGKIGTYEIELRIRDMYGNSVIKKVKLNVSKTESLSASKENDMEIVSISPKYSDYDGTITFKYEHAVNEETLDESDEYSAYLDLVSKDYSEINDNVYEQEILTLYNKYGYIVGFTVRLAYNDGTIEYVK